MQTNDPKKEAQLGTGAGSILGEVFNLRKIIAIASQKLGAQGEPLRLAMDRHLSGDYDGAISAVAGMPSGDAESEQEQAERWAREYEGGAAWAMLFSNERAEQAEAMLPLVREARAVGAALQSKLDEAQAEIERLKDAVCHAQSDEIDRLNAEIERLRGERAPLTEDEAMRWAESVIRDWRINSGVLSDLLLWANRGEIPPHVRAAPDKNEATSPAGEESRPFLVLSTKWSRGEHLSWWGSNRSGYTPVIRSESNGWALAGRYTAQEAEEICKPDCGAEPVLFGNALAMSLTVVPADSEKVEKLTSAGRAAIDRILRSRTAEPKAAAPREIRFVTKRFKEPRSYHDLVHCIGRRCSSLTAYEAYLVADQLWPNGDLSNLASYYAAIRVVFPDAKILNAAGNEIQ